MRGKRDPFNKQFNLATLWTYTSISIKLKYKIDCGWVKDSGFYVHVYAYDI